jgi:AraC-like DNA-binding protein
MKTKMDTSPSEKVYPVNKIALVLDALAAEGMPTDGALKQMRLSKEAIASSTTRVSLNQVIDCYDYAASCVRDPYFAYRTGLRAHLSAYGMYGFAILSSMNYRQTMQFAVNYHLLATPLTNMQFSETDGCGIWHLNPISNTRIDSRLYKFIVEMQFGIILSLHRDVMGPSFSARQFQVAYPQTNDADEYRAMFGAPVSFGQSANRLLFDAGWLDGTPRLGNEITYSTVVSLCDGQIEEFQLRRGLAGKIRQNLMLNLMRPMNFEEVAKNLNMSARTLRRKLREENTSFRQLVDELRRDFALRYLRDTDLTVEDIAETLGFSDAANFRHAFRRWTNTAPHEFRSASRD